MTRGEPSSHQFFLLRWNTSRAVPKGMQSSKYLSAKSNASKSYCRIPNKQQKLNDATTPRSLASWQQQLSQNDIWVKIVNSQCEKIDNDQAKVDLGDQHWAWRGVPRDYERYQWQWRKRRHWSEESFRNPFFYVLSLLFIFSFDTKFLNLISLFMI